MRNPFAALFEPEHEPEYEEAVEHDTVMVLVDGKLVEITAGLEEDDDDPEIRQ